MAQKTVSLSVVRFIAIFYIVMGVYQIWGGIQSAAYVAVAFGAPAVPGGIGVLLRKHWAPHLILAASLPVVIWWAWKTTSYFWVNGPVEPLRLNFFMLVPGFVLVAAMIGCPYLIYRYFNAPLDAT